MIELVVVNQPNRIQSVKRFMASRGVDKSFVVKDSTKLFDHLLAGTCNVTVFDYMLDISIINTLQDMLDSVNSLTVFVPESSMGAPYMLLTPNIYVLPNEYEWLSSFWDSDIFDIQNVLACEASGFPPTKIYIPSQDVSPTRLRVEARSRKVSVKYVTNTGRETTGTAKTLEVGMRIKGTPIKSTRDIRNQSNIFKTRNATLEFPDTAGITIADVYADSSETPRGLFSFFSFGGGKAKPAKVKKIKEPKVKKIKEPKVKKVKEPRRKLTAGKLGDETTTEIFAPDLLQDVTEEQVHAVEGSTPPFIESSKGDTKEKQPKVKGRRKRKVQSDTGTVFTGTQDFDHGEGKDFINAPVLTEEQQTQLEYIDRAEREGTLTSEQATEARERINLAVFMPSRETLDELVETNVTEITVQSQVSKGIAQVFDPVAAPVSDIDTSIDMSEIEDLNRKQQEDAEASKRREDEAREKQRLLDEKEAAHQRVRREHEEAEVIRRQKEKEEALGGKERISIDMSAATTVAGNSQSRKMPSIRKVQLSNYYTIEEHLLGVGKITQEQYADIMAEVNEAKSKHKIKFFGNIAAERGYISDEELASITSNIMRIEVLNWAQLDDMPLNFDNFTRERCLELGFFQTRDDIETGQEQIIASINSRSMDSSIRRILDNPRIRYTIDSYIVKKLK